VIVEVLTYDHQEVNIVVFQGRVKASGRFITFAVDHRLAQDIVNAMASTEDAVLVEVESWQVIG